MKISIDEELCQGHNRCFALAPTLVDVDDYGQAFVLNDGVVPAGSEDAAQLIIDNCPEFAISTVAE